MEKKVTFPELVELLAIKRDCTKREAENFLRELIALMTEVVSSGEVLRINGLGVFKPVWVEERASVNVQTGEPSVIPGHYKLTFTPAKAVREAVNEPFACFCVEELPDDAPILSDGSKIDEVDADSVDDDEPIDGVEAFVELLENTLPQDADEALPEIHPEPLIEVKEDTELFRSKAKKALLLYGDSAQQLYTFIKDKQTVSMEDIQYFTKFPVEQLVFNHRLPKKIARLAQYLNSESDELEERCTEEGVEKPKIIKYNSITEQYDAIISLIQNKNMEDVGILFRHNDEVERAYEYFKNHGVNVEAKYGSFMDLDFSSDNPKMMTYHSSKGLQFEHVFIPECTVEDDDNRNPLYVAVTRTYRALYVMHSGNLSSLFDDVPTSLYDTSLTSGSKLTL